MFKEHVSCLLFHFFFNIISICPSLIQGDSAYGKKIHLENFCWAKAFFPMQMDFKIIRHPTLAERDLVVDNLSGLYSRTFFLSPYR